MGPTTSYDAPYLNPTLYIGLGGTGKDVVMRLRKRLHDQFGTKKWPAICYLMVDTDNRRWWPRDTREEEYQAVRPDPDEFVDCSIKENEFKRVFESIAMGRQDLRFDGWLARDLKRFGPTSVVDGAGTNRQFGRLAFILHHDDIVGRIERNLAGIYDLQNRVLSGMQRVINSTGRLNIVIATSLGGGTGSGMCIDTAYLVKDLLDNDTRFRGFPARTTLIGVLPDVFESMLAPQQLEKLRCNAYAALLELEHYGTSATEDEVFVGADPRRTQEYPGVGFAAPWKDRKIIEGVAWDACYLVDCCGSNRLAVPLNYEDICQMIADHLAIDFQATALTQVKIDNSAEIAHVQGKVVPVWIRNAKSPSTEGETEPRGEVVFGTRYGCGYGSFGRSEILIPRDRIYRATACWLAAELVRKHWLGDPNSWQRSDYDKGTRNDFDGGDSDILDLNPATLQRELFKTERGNLLDNAVNECREISKSHSAEGSGRLRALVSRHATLLQRGPDPALAQQVLNEQSRFLSGSAVELGPLKSRLRDAVRKRANEFGVAVAREFLSYYRAATYVVTKSDESRIEPCDPGIARLAEADKLWWPARSIAQRIEFPRACESVRAYILGKYFHAASPQIQRVMSTVRDYIGCNEEAPPRELEPHGTLHAYFQRAEEQLCEIGQHLEGRFKELTSDRGTERCQFLLPESWDKKWYSERIASRLKSEGVIERGANGGFDCTGLEQAILRHFRNDRSGNAKWEVDCLTALLDRWEQDIVRGSTIADIAERLAEACYRLVAEVGLALEEVGGDNVVNLMRINDSDGLRKDRLERLVLNSGPYLALHDEERLAAIGEFTISTSNFLSGCEEDVPGVSDGNRLEFLADIQQIALKIHTDLRQLVPGSSRQATLALCREFAGFPLAAWQGLDSLREAYLRYDCGELHIDCRQTWDSLPRPNAMQVDEHRRIGNNAELAILAMLIGIVTRREDGTFLIRLLGTHGLGCNEYSLGMRISSVVRHICNNERCCLYVQDTCGTWLQKAPPKELALAYTSALSTWQLAKSLSHNAALPVVSPLGNCAALNAQLLERLLNETAEGRSWLEHIGDASNGPANYSDCTQKVLNELIDKRVLVCCSAAVPLYTVDWEEAKGIQLVDRLDLP